MRKIPCSQETFLQAKLSPAKLVKVYSMFPVDRANCDCAKLVQQWQRRLGTANERDRQKMIEDTPIIECPRDKSRMTRYMIHCNICNELQGYCWATNTTLTDWCDFHYVQWTTGDFWHGCFTPHISPVSEQLCFECCCGNDTRDFRANMKLPEHQAVAIENRNRIGREFGNINSKFSVQLAH